MYSILIIDDEPIVKIALRSILPWEEHGFFIFGTASNGLEAVPLIEKHHPDIIITDLKKGEKMIGYGFSDVCFQNGIFSVSCILHFFCGFVQTGKECIWLNFDF